MTKRGHKSRSAKALAERAAQEAPHPPAAPKLFEQRWFQGALLVLLVFIVYQPTLSAGFIWDDDMYVEENSNLLSLAGLRNIWLKPSSLPQYYPLVHTTFWIEEHLWGLWPGGYHAVNLLLHALAVVLAWRLLVRLAVPGAWLAAALFAVHPVEVESVAWVTERKNVLSCALALGAVLAYLRFSPALEDRPAASGETAPRHDWRFYALALALYLAALLSKTVTASVPAVLLVIYWWRRGRIAPRDVLRLAPFFALGLAMAAVTVSIEKEHVGARGPAWDLTMLERVLIAGRALWFYAGKLAWPHPLAFFYPRWDVDAGVWWQYLYPAAALAVIIALWAARHRMGRGPLAAVLIFMGVLTPALGFFNVYPFLYSFVADHFQYHASIALLALAAAALVLGVNRYLPNEGWVVPLVGALALVSLAALARAKTEVYHDLPSLYEDTIALNPQAWAAHTNLGYLRQREGDLAAAAAHYRQALQINPRYAALHTRLGTVLFLLGNTAEGLAELKRAVAGELSDDDRIATEIHLGIVLNGLGRFDEAVPHLQAALALDPKSASALVQYGLALEARGERATGIERVRESLAINPRSASGQYTLGTMLLRAGDAAEAIGPLTAAVQLQPNNGRFRQELDRALKQAQAAPQSP